MHDPMTVAFSNRLFTIWHKDPERDGSDDSCGWSYPRLTDRQRESIQGIAWAEAHNPWFQLAPVKETKNAVLAESLLRGAILQVYQALDIKATWAEVCRWACWHAHGGLIHFRGSLCHLPGYHTNSEKDTKSGREDTAFGLFSGLAKHILRERRPWYRHPRWHVWHWRIQVPLVLDLKRWLFSRCSKCGKGFPWGYAPISHQWDSDGPKWFKSEPDVFHHGCSSTVDVASGLQEEARGL